MTLLNTPAPVARTFSPESIRHQLLLTTVTPLSHHDAAVQDDSNRNLFNRQAILAQEVTEDAPHITLEQLQWLVAEHPVPMSIAPILRDFNAPEFLAALVVRTFADGFNSKDGEGLFSGMGRWQMLGNRVPHAAYASNLRDFWSRLTKMMQVSLPKAAGDEKLLRLLTIPRGTQLDILNILRNRGHDITLTARFWHDAQKQMSDKYHARVSEEGGPDEREWVMMNFQESQIVHSGGKLRRLEVPHLTGNSVRHQMLRESAMMHLFKALNIEPETLLPGVEAIFYNGGNIKAGATQPSNPAQLARQIRAAFPSLDLLGGVANAFDLGESAVSVHSLLVSRETAHLLPEWAQELPTAQVSAFDLIEDFTLTRMAGTTGEGQMIFSAEGLMAGVQFVVTFDLKPYTPQLARGALVSALETWRQLPTLGGGAARGFGQMRIDAWLRPDEAGDVAARDAYAAYLNDHADGLKEQLLSGKLGTDTVLVS